ncbi:MAG TPA: isoprenylcysteine carboxylmethyltransferase family protein [Candidatus Paceibacterota bacterium]|nr:isoprenylcysteine carboxylmethyltransferase family protein [Candidatus Paceibacterota bacterium]
MQPAAIVGLAWLVFIAVWFVSALSAKRTLVRHTVGWWIRIVVIVAAVVLASNLGRDWMRLLFIPWASAPLAWLGAALAVAGVALAIWARVYLGRNWGMPQAVKEDPELVTTGPYALVRHPIYTGMLLAMTGSALSAGLWWAIVLVGAGSYFILSAHKEEALMLATFPDAYRAYRARTKMLVPFIF